MFIMRTTLTLDSDIAAKVESEVRRTGKSFKETINGLLRLGLNVRREKVSDVFKVKARDLGEIPGISYDNIAELLEQIEGPSHR